MLVPQTEPVIRKWLVDSANAAAGSCSGGSDGVTCGLSWTNWSQGWDGKWGLGEQMSALEVMQNLMSNSRPAPYTADTGGSSIGNPAAGYGTPITDARPLSLDSGDKAGAGILTAVIGATLVGTCIWLIL